MNALTSVFCTHCGAAPGQPCRSVGGKIIVDAAHMARSKKVGLYELSDAERRGALEQYEGDAIRAAFGVYPSQLDPKVLKRARRVRSIDLNAPWVRQALGEDVGRGRRKRKGEQLGLDRGAEGLFR